MSKRLYFLFALALLLVGCRSPLHKSVLEPLSPKEIDKVVGEDKSFLTTYSIIEEKWNYIHTKEDTLRWQPITYSRLHNYILQIGSNKLNSPLFSHLRNEWEELNKKNNIAVDSIISGWKQYLVDNSPDSLLYVSLHDVETEKVRNIRKQIDTLVKASLKIKARRGTVDSLLLLYSFNHKDSSAIWFFPYNGELNHIRYRRKIKDSAVVKVYPYLPAPFGKRLVARDSLLQFKYAVLHVYSNGKCYSIDSLKKGIPQPVLELIELENSNSFPIYDTNYCREKIIKELVDPLFLSQSAYIKLNADKYYQQIDSLAFNFLNLKGGLQ